MDEISDNLPTGYVLDQYSIEAVLGVGGFGVTYKAYDNQLRQSVAIKEFLPSNMAGRAPDNVTVYPRTDTTRQFRFGLDKFLEEARTLARFRHSNIVRVSRFLEANGTAYLVMDYVEGESLLEYLKRTRKPVSETQLKAWFIPLLQGLVTVHAAGFLHRDIKPGNIYLRDNGDPVLIDFGAARQALGEHSNSVTGIFTAGYAPTEQYGTEAKKQGPWTDLYSVGATLYRCMAGQTPIDAPTRQSALVEGDADPLVPAREIGAGHYSASFLQLIDELMVLPIKDRPQTAAPVLAALEAGNSLSESEPPGTASTMKVDTSDDAETVLASAGRGGVAPGEPAPVKPMPAKGVDEPRKKSMNIKALGAISALLILGLLVAVLVMNQRHSAEIESRNAAQAAEQLRLAAEAQAEAQKREEAEALAQAEAQKRAEAEALALAEAQKQAEALALAETQKQAEALALAETQKQAEALASAQTREKPQAEPRDQAEDEMAAMQRQLNAQVMAQPFDAGDPAKIDAFIKDAMANDIKPVERPPSYWRSGYTCNYIRQYRYNYNNYRNCLYHRRYYGRYW
jgi:serine/threonine protein kinase